MRGISRRHLGLAVVMLMLNGGCGGPKRLPPVTVEPPTTRPPAMNLPPRDVPTQIALPALLQVGLLENQAELELLHAGGAAQVLDGDSGRQLVRLDPRDALHCRRQGSEVSWRAGGKTGRASAVVLHPVDPDHRVRNGAAEYRGEFLVVPSPTGGGLTLINAVDLEAYLQGVVPWEIGRHPAEKFAALQAQAIAARTYTIAHIGARRERGFDVFADVLDQVYKGAADEDPLCNRAIAATSGQVLQHSQREIEAYYSACCGGVSSDVALVWARDASPYLISHDDGPAPDGRAWCAGSRYFNWQETWSAARLTEILQTTLPEYLAHMGEHSRAAWAGRVFTAGAADAKPRQPGKLRDLAIVSRTTSGRVAELAVTTEAGVYHVRGDRVRWVLRPASGNPFILRSALFDLELVRDGARLVAVNVRGRGFGHGIGLCQTGALGMAAAGRDVTQILSHYYPGATLVRIPGMVNE